MGKHQPSEVRRAQILEAAMHVCADKGYHASRIDDIAAHAGLSKGAVYHHFASKQEVFLGLVEQMMAEATQVISQLDASGASAVETLNGLIDLFVGMFRDSPQVLRGLLEIFFLGVRDPEFRKHFDGYYSSMIEATEQVIRHGIDRGELDPDLDPEEAARVFVLGGDGLLLILVMLDRFEEGVGSVRAMSDLLLEGMKRKPGKGSDS